MYPTAQPWDSLSVTCHYLVMLVCMISYHAWTSQPRCVPVPALTLTNGAQCTQLSDNMAPIKDIGWNGYSWNTECLHGLGGKCFSVGGVTRCPSVFSAPPGLGATFNRTVGTMVGLTIGDEVRTYNRYRASRVWSHRPIGVNAWGPNLNMYRGGRPVVCS